MASKLLSPTPLPRRRARESQYQLAAKTDALLELGKDVQAQPYFGHPEVVSPPKSSDKPPSLTPMPPHDGWTKRVVHLSYRCSELARWLSRQMPHLGGEMGLEELGLSNADMACMHAETSTQLRAQRRAHREEVCQLSCYLILDTIEANRYEHEALSSFFFDSIGFALRGISGNISATVASLVGIEIGWVDSSKDAEGIVQAARALASEVTNSFTALTSGLPRVDQETINEEAWFDSIGGDEAIRCMRKPENPIEWIALAAGIPYEDCSRLDLWRKLRGAGFPFINYKLEDLQAELASLFGLNPDHPDFGTYVVYEIFRRQVAGVETSLSKERFKTHLEQLGLDGDADAAAIANALERNDVDAVGTERRIAS